MQHRAKLWSFNRKISVNIEILYGYGDYDGIFMIFEFCNVNTFLSVDLMRTWFRNIICEFNVINQSQFQELVTFHCGSYHFINKQSIKQSSSSSLLYHSFDLIAHFVDFDIKIDELVNPNINGKKIELTKTYNSSHCIDNKDEVN